MKTLTPEFQTALDAYMAFAQRIIDAHWTRMKFTHAPAPTLEYEVGSRYVSVFRHENGIRCSIHSFIDIKGGKFQNTMNKPGDVLKPASYKIPAKHARGNIFNIGDLVLTEHGPMYLR